MVYLPTTVLRTLSWLVCWTAGACVLAQDSLRLSLEQAVATALEANFDVKITAKQADLAANNNFAGATGMLPSVNATAGDVAGISGLNQKLASGVESSRIPVYANNLTAAVALSWTVFDGYRMFAIRDRLQASEALARLTYENTLRTTAFEVCLAYYGLVRLQTQQQALRETIAFFEERERLAKVRFETGATAKGEWLQAQTDLNEQRTALLQLQNAQNQFTADLSRLMNAPAVTPWIPSDTLPVQTLRMAEVNVLMDSALQRNPSLLALRQSLAVALAQRTEAAAVRYPQISLNGGFNAQSNVSTAGFLLLNQSAGFTGGITLSVPLYDGQRARHQVRAAELTMETRTLEIQQAEAEIRLTISRLQGELRLAVSRAAIEATTLELARENAGITQERYRRAQATAIELRQAQLAYVEAQTRLMEARYTACVANLQVRLLAGLPLR